MDRLAFRHAIAAHIGETLTPRLCAQIEAKVSIPPARYIELTQFDPEVVGEYVIRVERFADVLPELHRLHEAHFAETEKHRAGLELKPDYDGMAQADRGGRLLQFTVRHAGTLVGNLRMYVGRSAHTDNLIACEDTLYIWPAHRIGMLGSRLIAYAEKCLLVLAPVVEVEADSKLINGADVLLRRRRYEAVATKFHKILRRAAPVTE
jgi:hypothetical protein